MTAHPKVAEFLGRVDAKLASTPARSDRAVFLNMQLENWERLRAKLERWACDDSDDSPNPIGVGADVFDVDTIISGLLNRLEAVRVSCRSDIAAAQAEAL